MWNNSDEPKKSNECYVPPIIDDASTFVPNETGTTVSNNDDEDRRTIAMLNFSEMIIKKGISNLQLEFNLLKGTDYSNENTQVAFDNNMLLGKNRYGNIKCFDRTRVVLTYCPQNDTDYIHANWVISHFCTLTNKFICTQGPTSASVNDFWRMVWQTKAKHILMLCKNIESGREKCVQYFPTNVGDCSSYDTIVVKNVKQVTEGNEKVFESFRMCYYSTMSPSVNVQQITIHQWSEWPDFGVPSSGLAMFRILKIFRKDYNSTIIVHCSAGVGRTGTLIAAAMAYQILYEGKDLDISEVFKDMRRQRPSMLQTEGQYLFLHKAIAEYIQNKIKDKNILKQFFIQYKEYVKSHLKKEDKKPLEQAATKQHGGVIQTSLGTVSPKLQELTVQTYGIGAGNEEEIFSTTIQSTEVKPQLNQNVKTQLLQKTKVKKEKIEKTTKPAIVNKNLKTTNQLRSVPNKLRPNECLNTELTPPHSEESPMK